MQTYTIFKSGERRAMLSTNYITKRGNSAGVIEVSYLNLDTPVITAAFLVIAETNSRRNITKRVKGKLHSDLIKEVFLYEQLVDEANREVYGEREFDNSEMAEA